MFPSQRDKNNPDWRGSGKMSESFFAALYVTPRASGITQATSIGDFLNSLTRLNLTSESRVIIFGTVSNALVELFLDLLEDTVVIFSSEENVAEKERVFRVPREFFNLAFPWNPLLSSKCLVVVGTKGGVGKTTFTLMTAVSLALAGKRVLVVDTDPQSGLGNIVSLWTKSNAVFDTVQDTATKSRVTFHVLKQFTGGRETPFRILPTKELSLLSKSEWVIVDRPPLPDMSDAVVQTTHSERETYVAILAIPQKLSAEKAVTAANYTLALGYNPAIFVNAKGFSSGDVSRAIRYLKEHLQGVKISVFPPLRISEWEPTLSEYMMNELIGRNVLSEVLAVDI